MRTVRLLLFALVFFALAGAAQATQITVSSGSFPGWANAETAPRLRIFLNKPVVTSDSRTLPSGSTQSGIFYQSITCSIVGGALVVPQFTIDSLPDALVGSDAKYAAFLFRANGQQIGTAPLSGFGSFTVPALPLTTTWAAILTYNSTTVPHIDNLTYNRTQIDAKIAAAGGGLGDVAGPVSATDNAIVRFNGTTGKILQNSAVTIDDTTGAISGFKDKGGEVFNVLAYGATGNGTTDDFAALVAANAAAAAVAKGIVYLPAGTYAISNKFLPSAGVTIQGAGRKASFLKALPGFEGGIAEGTMIEWTSKDHITIADLGFLSNGQPVQGFRVYTSNDGRVANCYFDAGLQRMGIIVGPNMRNITIEGNLSEGTSLAENLAIVDASYCTIINNDIKQPTTANIFNGIEFFIVTPNSAIGNRVIGNSFKNLGSAGVSLGGDRGTTVMGNTFEGCVYGITAPENFGIPTTSASIIGNTIISSQATGGGITMPHASCTDFTITGNTVRDSLGIGILIKGTGHSLVGNTVRNSAGVGFTILASYSSISGNVSTNNSRGFSVEGDSNSIVGNTATDNRTPKIQDFGIAFLAGADENIYGGNELTGNLGGEVSDSGSMNSFKAFQIVGGSSGTSILTLKGDAGVAPTVSRVVLAPGDDTNMVLIGTVSDTTSARVQLKQRTGFGPLSIIDSSDKLRISVPTTMGLSLFSAPATSGVTTQDTGPLDFFRSRWTGSANAFERFSITNVSQSSGAGNYVLNFTDELGTSTLALGGSGRGNGVAVGLAFPFASANGQFHVRSLDVATPTVGFQKITSQTADLLRVYDTDGTTVKVKIDSSFNFFAAGIISAGTTPTTLTNAAGKVLVGALAITGTPDGSKFLRDDGSWQAAGGGANAALSNLASVAINADLLPASTQSLGSASFPWLSSFVGNTTQYESVTQSAGLLTHTLAGSATNIGWVFNAKGAGTILFGSSGGGSNPTVAPGGDGAGMLGVSTLRWGGLFLFGNINISRDDGALIFRSSGTTNPLFLTRPAAANLQLGDAAADTNALIVAQKLSVQNLLAGGTSNQAGKDFTIAGSQGKGTGAGGSIIVQTSPAGSSGTAVNALVTAFTIDSTGAVALAGVVFANLGTPANGVFRYCSDCTIASPCAGSGTGALAKRLNGVWVCN